MLGVVGFAGYWDHPVWETEECGESVLGEKSWETRSVGAPSANPPRCQRQLVTVFAPVFSNKLGHLMDGCDAAEKVLCSPRVAEASVSVFFLAC